MKMPSDRSRAAAFTLIELLVSIGIIVLLVSILIPAVMRANKTAMRARTSTDFQSIAMALEAYKQDFGDIPRLPTYSSPATAPNFAGNPMANTGAATLGKALLGPYGDGLIPNTVNPDPTDPPLYQPAVQYHAGDCVNDGAGKLWVDIFTTDSIKGMAPAYGAFWQEFTATDNADGPGFRVHVDPTGKPFGKVWGPYLQPGKIKNQGVDLLDPNGSPILYFAARLGSIDVTKDAGAEPQPYISINPTSVGPITSLYDASDNIQAFYRGNESSPTNDADVLNRIRIMMGNYGCNGHITVANGDVAVSQPYLLWSAGPDGQFGPMNYPRPGMPPTIAAQTPTDNQRAVAACDDVTNFR